MSLKNCLEIHCHLCFKSPGLYGKSCLECSRKRESCWDSPNSFPRFRMIFSDKTYLANPNLQLQVFEEVSKVCPDVLALRDNDLLLRFFLDFLERLHTEADLAVLDSDDFDSHFVANAQHI